MIEALLSCGVAPQKIIFISVEHPMLKFGAFNGILERCHENVRVGQDCYYFFDEVQHAQDWDKWLKTIYDIPPDTHVAAAGSFSKSSID